MPLTLASLVQHSALKLSVRAGESRLDTPVRWAHVSELADPVPYMEGGELLLITAMKLDAEDPEEMLRYVRRLAAAGVVGLGFAVGVNYEAVPDALVEAARAEDLPLLEVPRRTPFLAISKAVSAALAADQYRAVTAGFGPAGTDPGRALRRRARRTPHPARRPRARLGRALRHLRRGRRRRPRVGRAPGRPAHPRRGTAARAARPRQRRRRRLRGPRRTPVPGHRPPRPGRPRRRYGSPLGTAERYAVHSAVALLTLTTERSRSLHDAESRLGAAVLRLLLDGETAHARAVAGDLYGVLLDAPFRLVIAEPALPGTAQPEGLALLADAVESAAARSGEALLVVTEPDRLLILAADGGAAAGAVADHAEALESRRGRESTGPEPDELVVGLSAPAGPATAAAAYKQADQALVVARRRGRPLVEHDDLAAGSVLPLLADDAVRAFADGTLRALRDHDAIGRGDLVASLQAWLSRHGQWDAAAADLGVHRHTLRYRMRRVEEILGRSLDDPDVRMELWLALKVTGADAPA